MLKRSQFEEHALAVLRKVGLRVTMPRVQVIRALASSDEALDAYKIHDIIMAAGGRIDVVSVYRILYAFLEHGLVYRVGLLDGKYIRRETAKDQARRVLFVDRNRGTAWEADFDIDIRSISLGEYGVKPLGFQLEVEVAA